MRRRWWLGLLAGGAFVLAASPAAFAATTSAVSSSSSGGSAFRVVGAQWETETGSPGLQGKPFIAVEMSGVPSSKPSLSFYDGHSVSGPFTLITTVAGDTYVEHADGNVTVDIMVPSSIEADANYFEVSAGGTMSNVQDVNSFLPVWVTNWWQLESYLTDEFAPSASSLAGLTSAINNLESHLGVTQITSTVTDLSGLGSSVSGSATPASYGGSSCSVSAFGIPTLYAGSSKIPVVLFPECDVAKYTWLHKVREVAEALMWLAFAIWLVGRFAPLFKV